MILDAISNGDFRPEQMGFMDDEMYQDAMQEIRRCRATLMERCVAILRFCICLEIVHH